MNQTNNQRYSNKKKEEVVVSLPEIFLNIKKDPELFNETAKKCAEAILKTKKTQIRKFYDELLSLNQRAKTQNWEDVLPFVKMLNAKVAYARARNVINEEFVRMISSCVAQVKEKKDLEIFKLFFEAVLGFHKGGK